MRKLTKLFVVLLIAASLSAYSQKLETSNFGFPNTKMGDFAKEWLKSINNDDIELLRKYNLEREWDDHLKILINISKKSEGIIPYQISYETIDLFQYFLKKKMAHMLR